MKPTALRKTPLGFVRVLAAGSLLWAVGAGAETFQSTGIGYLDALASWQTQRLVDGTTVYAWGRQLVESSYVWYLYRGDTVSGISTRQLTDPEVTANEPSSIR